jgi:hypothetical protein
MKFCQAVLVIMIGMTAEMALEAQMLPAGNLPSGAPVLVASGSMPSESLVPGHDSLLQALPMTPEIRQAAAPVPSAPTPRLSRQDRWILFWNDTYASPGAFAGLFAGALVDQIDHSPAKWDGDGSGYTRRFASEYGQLATRNVIHEGLAGITGLDPRYSACRCTGVAHRSAHALEMTFTTYRQDGRLTLDVPQIASAYGSGMVSTYWYPHHQFRPLVQGIQFGHEQMGEIMVGHMVQEFSPDLKRALHLHALTAHSFARPSDDN